MIVTGIVWSFHRNMFSKIKESCSALKNFESPVPTLLANNVLVKQG